jgi:hypothetical protein
MLSIQSPVSLRLSQDQYMPRKDPPFKEAPRTNNASTTLRPPTMPRATKKTKEIEEIEDFDSGDEPLKRFQSNSSDDG